MLHNIQDQCADLQSHVRHYAAPSEVCNRPHLAACGYSSSCDTNSRHTASRNWKSVQHFKQFFKRVICQWCSHPGHSVNKCFKLKSNHVSNNKQSSFTKRQYNFSNGKSWPTASRHFSLVRPPVRTTRIKILKRIDTLWGAVGMDLLHHCAIFSTIWFCSHLFQ